MRSHIDDVFARHTHCLSYAAAVWKRNISMSVPPPVAFCRPDRQRPRPLFETPSQTECVRLGRRGLRLELGHRSKKYGFLTSRSAASPRLPDLPISSFPFFAKLATQARREAVKPPSPSPSRQTVQDEPKPGLLEPPIRSPSLDLSTSNIQPTVEGVLSLRVSSPTPRRRVSSVADD